MRWTVCGLLSRHGDERAVEPLIQVLLSDDWPDIRMLAADVLGEIGDRRALEALHYAEQHDLGVDYENRTVRDAASEAISAILQKQ
jgi:HEAT repeat protein